ncbi:MAG: M48 family metallopeptidase [Fuerstiella sp.]
MDVVRSIFQPRFRTGLLTAAALGLTASLFWILPGCSTTPVTQRRQLVLMSPEKENAMGLAAYQQVLEDEPVTKNETIAELVQRVGDRIAAVADRPDFDWEFKVIESETQNAFCLPGGKVAVYTGMLPVCESEAGLAVVMSHEIGHAIARHGGERMSLKTVQTAAQHAVQYVMREQKDDTQKIVLAAYGAGSQYGAILPYSRKHELEADEIGLMLMAKAGYDPSEAPRFWERFAGLKDGGAPLEFLSTHPSDARRSAALREKLPEAIDLYQDAPEKIGMGELLAEKIKAP